jgi:peptidoglycan-associated lipoprotein
VLLFLVAGASACSHIGREEFDTTIGGLRQDLGTQDERISQNESEVASLRSDLDALKADLEALRTEFEVTVTELENGIRFATPVHFEFDSADLRAEDTALLDRFATVVQKYYPDAVVTVEGFADPAGSRSYNKRLSERRAETVASYLTGDAGLDPASVRTVGYGETRLVRPDAAGPGDAGLENRRVSFVIEFTG